MAGPLDPAEPPATSSPRAAYRPAALAAALLGSPTLVFALSPGSANRTFIPPDGLVNPESRLWYDRDMTAARPHNSPRPGVDQM